MILPEPRRFDGGTSFAAPEVGGAAISLKDSRLIAAVQTRTWAGPISRGAWRLKRRLTDA